MKKELSLKDPIISVYSNIANAQAVLLNYKKGRNWIAENFINYVVFWDEELKEIKPHFLSVSNIYLGGNYQMFSRNIFIPCLKCYTLNRNMIEVFGGIINFIKWSIDKDYYVSFFINRKYINVAELKEEQMHETFVYGYDDELRIVLIVDYFKGAALQSYRCRYEEIEDAFLYVQDYYLAEGKRIPITDIMLTKYEERTEEFDRIETKEIIRQKVISYMKGDNLGGKINFLHTSFEKNAIKYWGMESYDAFIKYFEARKKSQQQTKFVVVHHLQHLLDHKKSINFMINEFYAEERNVTSETQELVNIADTLRNYAIKLWISKRKITNNEAKKIIEMLENMREKEKKIFAQIVDIK